MPPTQKAPTDRAPCQIHKEIHAFLRRQAEHYGYGVGEFMDLLLQYATCDPGRIEQAIAERNVRGSNASRKAWETDKPSWASSSAPPPLSLPPQTAAPESTP